MKHNLLISQMVEFITLPAPWVKVFLLSGLNHPYRILHRISCRKRACIWCGRHGDKTHEMPIHIMGCCQCSFLGSINIKITSCCKYKFFNFIFACALKFIGGVKIYRLPFATQSSSIFTTCNEFTIYNFQHFLFKSLINSGL